MKMRRSEKFNDAKDLGTTPTTGDPIAYGQGAPAAYGAHRHTASFATLGVSA